MKSALRPERFESGELPIKSEGKSVIYVMSRDQRVENNHALAYAQITAIEQRLPLAVLFLLNKKGMRAKEHYEFMLTGLTELERSLEAFNIPFIMLIGNPDEVLRNSIAHFKPAHIFFDFSPLRGPRLFIEKLRRSTSVPVHVVDTHNVVPVWYASQKCEVGARTLRPKIHSKLPEFIEDLASIKPHPYAWNGVVLKLGRLKQHIDKFLDSVPSNGQILKFPSGEKNAQHQVRNFISNNFDRYAEFRNDPTRQSLSGLSPYFHFGQISTLQVISLLRNVKMESDDTNRSYNTFVEEALVRKELSDNFCYYGKSYTSIEGAPKWAQTTLLKHTHDTREFTYTQREFEEARTHDSAWNAAQNELLQTGKMHGYMRMYWAKKILEWSDNPKSAIQTLIYLNDFYSIDGGDPNGYTGIMWSVAGLHDRPWGERPIYGSIRSMVYGGLKRKFPIKEYEEKWNINS